jgi:predicted secreted protein
LRKTHFLLFFLLLCIPFTTLFSASAVDVTTESYNLVLAKGQSHEFRLSGNPTTGCEWWIQDKPANLEVIELRHEAGTLSCPPNSVGCGQEFTVYSVKSDVLGEYIVEFRFGHPWNHDEYYIIAYLHVTVQDIRPTTTYTVTGQYSTQPTQPLFESLFSWLSDLFAWLQCLLFKRC